MRLSRHALGATIEGGRPFSSLEACHIFMTHIKLTDSVRRALEVVPNVSKLAKAAGVSQSLLARIQAGEREATPAVAAKVAAVLERWSAEYSRPAARIRQATPGGSDERD